MDGDRERFRNTSISIVKTLITGIFSGKNKMAALLESISNATPPGTACGIEKKNERKKREQ
jgi:hypothetical protein